MHFTKLVMLFCGEILQMISYLKSWFSMNSAASNILRSHTNATSLYRCFHIFFMMCGQKLALGLISLHIRSMWETICDAWACWSGWNFGPNSSEYPYSVVQNTPPKMKIVRESKSEYRIPPQWKLSESPSLSTEYPPLHENCQRVQVRVQNTPPNENCQRVQVRVQNTPQPPPHWNLFSVLTPQYPLPTPPPP